MAPSPRPAAPAARAVPAPEPTSPYLTCFVAWIVPGAGHLMVGQTRKAAVFFVMLIAMFAIGIYFGGRLFPFQLSEPLVFLAAIAEWALGLPRLVAAMAGAGQGDIIAETYEAGNTFLIVSGLLNMLVVLDAYDRVAGRTPR